VEKAIKVTARLAINLNKLVSSVNCGKIMLFGHHIAGFRTLQLSPSPLCLRTDLVGEAA